MTSVGQSHALMLQQQQQKLHYVGAPRPPPTGAPPSTPIGDEAATNPQQSGRFGNNFQTNVIAGQQQQGRIRLTAENYPELFVEHF
jgi:hypothetical protein